MAEMIPPVVPDDYPGEGECQVVRCSRDDTGLPVLQAVGRVEFALSEVEGGRVAALRVDEGPPATVQLPASSVARPLDAEA